MSSIPELIRARLTKDRSMTTLTVAVPIDVVESMKRVAERRGFDGVDPLVRSYLGDGLRRDEADMLREAAERPGPPR